MTKTNARLAAAKQHGKRAVAELRHMTADTALHWVMSHKGRVAQFRRTLKGTGAARPFDKLLALMRTEATPVAVKHRAVRKVRRTRTARRTRTEIRPWTYPI